MTKFFKKSQKPYFGVILGNFCPNFGKNVFFWKKKALTVFKYSNYLSWCKKTEKTNNKFLIKMPNCWWTDKQTDRELWIYRTLHRTGVQKIKFRTECDSFWEGKNNCELNPFIKTMVHRSNMHYSRIYQKGNWKNHIQFLLELQINETSQAPSSGLHLEGILNIDTQLKSDSHLPKFFFICFSDEKYFLFHLKSSFRSQDM